MKRPPPPPMHALSLSALVCDVAPGLLRRAGKHVDAERFEKLRTSIEAGEWQGEVAAAIHEVEGGVKMAPPSQSPFNTPTRVELFQAFFVRLVAIVESAERGLGSEQIQSTLNSATSLAYVLGADMPLNGRPLEVRASQTNGNVGLAGLA